MPRPLRSPGRVLAALLLLLAAVLVPAAAATSGTEPPDGIGDGALTWEVRRSFNDYVGAENITTGDGATREAGGRFVFPLQDGTFDPATGSTELRLDGLVHYATYCGFFPGWDDDECALDLSLSELRLVIDPGEQTLYARVVSRPLTSGADVPAVIDHGVIPLVRLDVADAGLEVSGGTTAWTDLATGLAAEAVPAFGNYPAGAPFAPIDVTYDGPGGRPVVDEQWTPPWTPVYEEAGRWLNPTAGSVVHGVHVDTTGDVAYVVAGPATPQLAPYVQAVDATSLAPLGGYAPAGLGSTQFAGAFDPGTGMLFLPQQSSLRAVRWDAAAGAFAGDVVGELPAGHTLQANPVWDAATSTLHTLTADAAQAATLVSWTRADDGWTSAVRPLPPHEGWLSYWYSPGSVNDSLAVTPSGDLVLARANGLVIDDTFEHVLDQPAALLLTVTGDEVEAAEIPGTGTSAPVPLGDPTRAWSQVYAGPDGQLAFTSSDFTAAPSTGVLTATAGDGGVSVAAEPVVLDESAGLTLSGSFDAGSATFWAKDAASGRHWAVAGDAVLTTFVPADAATYPRLAAGADSALYSAVRTADRQAGLARLAVTAMSPAVTTQPADTTVAIVPGATTATAVLTAAATGAPDPGVRWQRSDPGSLTFTDVPGATTPELRLEAAAGDSGTRYRAVFGNAAGELATEAATLTVHTAPVVVVGAQDVTVAAGEPATFTVIPGGDPTPDVTWQHERDGAWVDLTTDDGYEVSTGSLTVPAAGAGHDGLRVRARLSNAVATVDTEPATLTVEGTGTPTPTPTPIPTPTPTPTPTETPTASPSPTSSPSPTGSASPTPPSSGDGGSGPGDDDLPDTGLSLGVLVAVAAALLLAGLGGAVVRLRS
ncbi:HtaA domain-containing protein [Jiangella alkaliphila]|uniref:Htaa protein n=1 Tax=Jiangella alkaliphila TaxID=419479 RepID=A0A1H2KJ75_9ACTN|nr:HtaA domain-containing protein [Jiangella alkaliphila]SDU68466.1 Htaa protein [Jiangella alkaliphila]